jgi:probable F420-dependent oxidoreductase
MDFGVVLQTYLEGATGAGIVETARVAERLRFASVWTTDHVLMPRAHAGPYAFIYEALTTLGYVAAATERVQVGISVIVVPQRHPVVLAKELATLDALSSGRVIAGVGAGWCEGEFAFLGAADRFHRRGAVLDEAMRLMRALWTDPGAPFEGRFFQYRDVAFGPLPVQPSGPPFWVGGSSPAAQRRTARLAEAWHPVGMEATTFAAQAPTVLAEAEAAGRPAPALTVRLTIALDEPAERVSGPTVRPGYVLHGDAEAVTAGLTAYAEAGCSHIVCNFGSGPAEPVIARMERFAQEIMPRLADA